jgi:hypothetical protein
MMPASEQKPVKNSVKRRLRMCVTARSRLSPSEPRRASWLPKTTRQEPTTTTYIEHITATESEMKNQDCSQIAVPGGGSRWTMDSNAKPTRMEHCVISTVYRFMWKSSSSCRMPSAWRLAVASHTCLPVRNMTDAVTG